MLYTQLFQALYFHAGNDCLGSYNIYDSRGEQVRTFFAPQIEEKEEEESTEEINIDFNTGEEEEIPEEPKKKRRKKDKSNIGEVNADGVSEMLAAPDEKYKKEDEAAENVELDPNSELEQKVEEYIEAAKGVKLSQIGHKYFVKINFKENEEIIGVYTSKDRAMERCRAIQKGCTYKRSKSPALPYHCRFMLDEFANIGQIPDFTKKLATMRKHEISCSIILQNMAQIKTMYKDDWGSVMGNCDSLLFLGCPEVDTLEYISKLLGNEEIKTTSNSISGGKNGNQSESISKKTKPLMSIDELHRMDNNKCIFVLRGEYPFFDDKCTFDESIKNYEFTADADENNTYIVKKKLQTFEVEESSFGKREAKKNAFDEDNEHSSSSYYTQDEMEKNVNPNVNLSIARMANEYEDSLENTKNTLEAMNSLFKHVIDPNGIISNKKSESEDSSPMTESDTLGNDFFDN